MNTPRELFEKRKARVRTALKNAANGKPRLSVFRSGKHIYVQQLFLLLPWIKKSEKASRSRLRLKLPALSVRPLPNAQLRMVLVKLFSTEAATSITVVLKHWLTLHALLV